MQSLPHPDIHHLQAAQGWLELGNHLEANEELERIAAPLRSHPDVLELRWQIYFKAEQRNACLDIATALVRTAPKRAVGHLHLASSLHRLKRTQEAYDTLRTALTGIGENSTLLYDLACYCAQLGKLDEARERLQRAFEIGDAKNLKLMALDNSDLESLWNGIGNL